MNTIRPLFPVIGPFVKAKTEFGYSGVIEYDETEDKVRCHECGEWFESLGPHLFRIHKTTAAAHKLKFGLNLNMPLCGNKLLAKRREQMLDSTQQMGRQRLRANMKRKGYKSAPKRQHGTRTEAWKNLHGLCDLQMKTRYQLVKEKVGHMPTTTEMKTHDAALLSAIERRHKTLNEFRKHVGDQPKTAQDYQMLSHQKIIESLQNWHKEYGRVPKWRDFIKSAPPYPQATTICGHFGSWNNALSLAGLV